MITRIIFGVCVVGGFFLAVAKEYVPATILISLGIAMAVIKIQAWRKSKRKE